ncbi:MAG TPA: DUF3617 domain-containing protein [Rhizomicrobium sp.]|nr:DUF3617 domain-containing protein [Rhizomicrobium sp.]
MRSIRPFPVVLSAVLLPLPALAAHGKAGLWEVTTTMNMPNMAAQIPPAQLAQMRAHGIKLPTGNTITATHCMTAQEVAMDKPPPMPNRHGENCKMQNMKVAGQAMSADMVCSGANMQGTGHFQIAYDSSEHYSGKMSFNMTAHGRPMAMSNSFEGRWVSADCKAH